MAVLTASLVERLETAPTGITVHCRSGIEEAQLDAEAVFFAVGRPGNADTLGAVAVGIEVTRVTLRSARTFGRTCRRATAGDVNGSSMLVPSARHEGRIAAENAVLSARPPSLRP